MTRVTSSVTIAGLPAAMAAVLDRTAVLDGELPLERHHIEALLSLTATTFGRQPGFVEPLAAVVADYVLYQERPTARLSDDTAAWLHGLLVRDGHELDPARMAVLQAVLADSQEASVELQVLALAQIGQAAGEGKPARAHGSQRPALALVA